MTTLKQRLGASLVPRLLVNPWVFRTFRVELNAVTVRLLNRIFPGRIARQRALRQRTGVLVNVGCGQEGWVNLDLFPEPDVTMRVDCRRRLPLGDGATRGIHVDHHFEHLEPGGVLRIIVPDMRKHVEAYLADDWMLLNEIGCGGQLPQSAFATKMEALNHVFVQDGEHYGGFDAEYLRRTLERAGFADIEQVAWRDGGFPERPIDREEHRLDSLFMEAHR
jgi:predicted SAM-dependent methyltransferase